MLLHKSPGFLSFLFLSKGLNSPFSGNRKVKRTAMLKLEGLNWKNVLFPFILFQDIKFIETEANLSGGEKQDESETSPLKLLSLLDSFNYFKTPIESFFSFKKIRFYFTSIVLCFFISIGINPTVLSRSGLFTG